MPATTGSISYAPTPGDASAERDAPLPRFARGGAAAPCLHKALLATRPIFHQTDEAIRGHVFCSFLALVLRKELEENGWPPHG